MGNEESNAGLEVTDELLESIRENPGYKEVEGRLRVTVKTQDLIPQIKLYLLKESGLKMEDDTRRDEFVSQLHYQLVNQFVQMQEQSDLSSDERVFLMIMLEDIARTLIKEYLVEKNLL